MQNIALRFYEDLCLYIQKLIRSFPLRNGRNFILYTLIVFAKKTIGNRQIEETGIR